MILLLLFELGYILQHSAIIFQILEISKRKNTEGISIETLLFFVIGTVCRVIWFKDSLLSSYFLTYIEVPIGVISLTVILYYYRKYSINDYLRTKVKPPFYLSFPILFIVISIFSMFLNPGYEDEGVFSIQTLVSGNIYSECLGLLPQLYLIVKGSETGNISVFYLVFLCLARFFRLFFWVYMYLEGSHFISLIIADVIHSVILSIFIYFYSRNKDNITLPVFLKGESNQNRKIF